MKFRLQTKVIAHSKTHHLNEHEHLVFLTDEVRDYDGKFCASCGTPVRTGCRSYACFICKFAVHENCQQNGFYNKSNTTIRLKCQDPDLYVLLKRCSYCGERCAGSITCNADTCHESCSLLPSEINHNFHPSHKLLLESLINDDKVNVSHKCSACRSGLWGSGNPAPHKAYQCTDSKCLGFSVHIQCAQKMPMLHHDAHEHPLTLVSIKQQDTHNNDIQCKWCGRGWEEAGTEAKAVASFGIYRCVPCDFSLHEDCSKYPKELLSDEERQHSLQYIPPDCGEYTWSSTDYCEACGKDIAQGHPVYKCLTCPNDFLFHLDCALLPPQEIRPVSQGDSVKLLQEIRNAFGMGKFRAPAVPALLSLDERISKSKGKIECLTLSLEESIRKLCLANVRLI